MEIVPVKVSQEVNKKLKEPYTVNEVRKTLFQMHPTKASRIDGFSAMFYQKFWELVQYDVCEEVLKFLNEGELDQSMNETLIILVPKIKCACTVGEFRPISLYNVIMNIITKVLANRLLKDSLPEIISQSQSDFVKGRLTSDNILVAHELANVLTHRKLGQDGLLSLKIDMSKAYDRVDWMFLERILLKMGFDETWVRRVLKCVCSISYKVKVNGDISEQIIPGRGLRQGDPLSPLPFYFMSRVANAETECRRSLRKFIRCEAGKRISTTNKSFILCG
ncbi:unnamed protein product [Rhodiola kirilowii]